LKIFSLSYLIEFAAQLPDPSKAATAEAGYASVLRLPIPDWDAVRDAAHPEREFEAHKEAFVEFEVIPWKDTRGVIVPRWVLRGLVAI
jgi:hypothetical protein